MNFKQIVIICPPGVTHMRAEGHFQYLL